MAALAHQHRCRSQIRKVALLSACRLSNQALHWLRRQIVADVQRLRTRRLAEIKRLVAVVCTYEDLGERYRLALSVTAVGERTASALVVRMPELGHVSREQAASLAGLAPFVH